MNKKELLLKFNFLKNPSLGQLRFHEKNNLFSVPNCKNTKCSNQVSWYKNRYRTFCSSSCANSNSEVILKRKKTSIEKYGVTCPLLSDKIKSISKNTMLIKYGVDHPSRSKKIKEKTKITNIEKYGVENPNILPEIQLKIKKTNLERYGVEHPKQLVEFKEKAKQTNLERYGVENPFQSEEIKEKVKLSLMERYGVENPFQSEEIKEKIKQTNLERYGVDHINKLSTTIDNRRITNLEKFGVTHHLQAHITNYDEWIDDNMFIQLYHNFNGNILSLMKYFNVSDHPIRTRSLHLGLRTKFESSYETELSSFFDQHNISYIRNTYKMISNLQLDFYFPEKNVAVEFNGNYWHSELSGGKNSKYHLNKLELSKDKGIQLFHIFEYDWNNNKSIIKSIILNSLGLNSIIYARKTKVIVLDKSQVKNFLNDNHNQGYNSSTINLGLYHNDELVSVMTFSKSRYNKKYEWELIRFCNKLNHNVIGGAQKLFSYFIKTYNPTSIITYSERRLFTGKVYEKLGFEFLHFSAPNYLYTNNYQDFYSRIKFQKHKLSNLLEIFNPDLTEWENMRLNGWDRIWDCGNSVWEWNK